mgnify:CR=1 FL=1
MANVLLVYWSGTGNTEIMAEKIKEGLESEGATVDFRTVDQVDPSEVSGFDKIAFGCPSMGVEVLEEDEFEPFFEAVEGDLSGKKVALFGSYGWGDGEWMRDWEQTCKSLGANLVCDSVICNEEPDEDAQNSCIELGRSLVM